MNRNMNNRIAVWLQETGHTKQDLAAMLGMTPRTLQNRMSDTYEWSWYEVQALAEILGCSVEELV